MKEFICKLCPYEVLHITTEWNKEKIYLSLFKDQVNAESIGYLIADTVKRLYKTTVLYKKNIHFIAKLHLRFREELSGSFKTLVTVKGPKWIHFWYKEMQALKCKPLVFLPSEFFKEARHPFGSCPLGSVFEAHVATVSRVFQ